MRIGVSLLAFRPGRIGGAETYVRKLLESLPQHAGSDELLALVDRDMAASLAAPGFTRVVVPSGQTGLVARRALEAFTGYRARGVSGAIEASGADVVLFPQQSVFPLRVGVRAVVTVHDLQHLEMPQNFGALEKTFRARVYAPSLDRADRIIAISNVTRQQLVERCGVDPRRVEVVPHGFSPTVEETSEPWSPGAPYLYYPAASYPHKGHDVLLRSFAALQPRGWARYRLVFTGMKTSHWAKLRRLVRELRLDEKVIHLGFVPPGEVSRIYAGAEAVVFPTRFEGFGLPVLEAVERRKKVIVSRLPIFDELGVPRRWQIDFEEPDQLAAAVALEGPTEIEKKPWTWSEVGRRTIAVLREAADQAATARSAR